MLIEAGESGMQILPIQLGSVMDGSPSFREIISRWKSEIRRSNRLNLSRDWGSRNCQLRLESLRSPRKRQKRTSLPS